MIALYDQIQELRLEFAGSLCARERALIVSELAELEREYAVEHAAFEDEIARA